MAFCRVCLTPPCSPATPGRPLCQRRQSSRRAREVLEELTFSWAGRRVISVQNCVRRLSLDHRGGQHCAVERAHDRGGQGRAARSAPPRILTIVRVLGTFTAEDFSQVGRNRSNVAGLGGHCRGFLQGVVRPHEMDASIGRAIRRSCHADSIPDQGFQLGSPVPLRRSSGRSVCPYAAGRCSRHAHVCCGLQAKAHVAGGGRDP